LRPQGNAGALPYLWTLTIGMGCLPANGDVAKAAEEASNFASADVFADRKNLF
jgi:hypothetical protein